MKYTVNTYKIRVLLSFLFSFACSGYGQEGYIEPSELERAIVTDEAPATPQAKYEQLKLALLEIKFYAKEFYANTELGKRSISIIEDPAFRGTFILASGSNSVLKFNRFSKPLFMMIRRAVRRYYSTTFNELIILSGRNNSENLLMEELNDRITFKDWSEYTTGEPYLGNDGDEVVFEVYERNIPGRVQVALGNAAGRERVALHSEIALMTYLQLYNPNSDLDPATIAFPSDLTHCARCYNYLYYNGFHVPDIQQSASNTKVNGEHIYKGVMTLASLSYPWSPPNFFQPTIEPDTETLTLPLYTGDGWNNRSIGNGPVGTTSKLNTYTTNYISSAFNNGLRVGLTDDPTVYWLFDKVDISEEAPIRGLNLRRLCPSEPGGTVPDDGVGEVPQEDN